ncbi:MAG TPA: family 20 glycosylhydrolase [Actinokineospora sp.]|nr:family 20 glycosylhydrolase [Actinokineospora sp.]
MRFTVPPRFRALIAQATVVTTVAGALVVAAAVPASASAAADVVVPRVSSWTPATGTFTLTSTSRIVVDTATASSSTTGPTSKLSSARTLTQAAQKLRTDLIAVTGRTLSVVTGGVPAAGDIALALSNSDSALGVEGYKAVIGSSLAVTAPTSTGVFYASRTILQMLRTDPGTDQLTYGTVRDLPSQVHRAVSLDVGRRFWPVADIQTLIRQMSWHKLNVLALHFNEDEGFRLYSANYAGMAPTNPAYRYSKADIAAIEAVAAEHHITIVPEIDMPAHATAIALGGGADRSLQTQCGSSYKWVLNYIDAPTRTWAHTMLTEFVSWFSGPYVHIGNDEVPDGLATCAYAKNAVDTDPAIDDFDELQERFIAEQNAVVKAAGKRAMIWVNGDHIQPELDVIIVNFGSYANAGVMRGLGYDVLDTAYSGSAGRFYWISAFMGDGRNVPKGDIYRWTPVAGGGRNLGQEFAVWSDHLNFAETEFYLQEMDPRRAELGERTWNSSATTVTYAQFLTKVANVGNAPGVTITVKPRTPTGQPDHYYDFNSSWKATSATHFPDGYTFTTARDGVGGLHASSLPAHGPALPATGLRGSGARFTANVIDRLQIGGADVAPPWTVATWIRREANGTDTQLLRGTNSSIKVEQNGTTNRVGITQYGVGDFSFNYTLPLNVWTHLAIVAAPTGTTLYANGVAVQTITQTVPLAQASIGGDRAFGGTLDELRVYDEALSATQVAALHSAYQSDMALGQPVTASGVETAAFPESNVADGIPTTRWSSLRADPQWIRVDLGSVKAVNRVRLSWEAAYGRDYQIQVSTDGVNFTTVRTVTGGDGGVDDLTGLAGSGRYVRVNGTARGTSWGYSLWSVEVM